VKRLVKEATFLPKTRGGSPIHQGHSHDDNFNDHSYHGSSAKNGGKVLPGFYYSWSKLTLLSNSEPE
jgi:hypothetical protein